MIEAQKENLRKLTVRIQKQTDKGHFEGLGSGLLYIHSDGSAYVLTACHVLDDFKKNEYVIIECYPDIRSEGSKKSDNYLFYVKRNKIWSYYSGKVPDNQVFNQKDVAVIPLAEDDCPKRDWMEQRSKAFFIPEAEELKSCTAIGFGYPKFKRTEKLVNACVELPKGISCSDYNRTDHRIEWIHSGKLSDDERDGHSGSLFTLDNTNSIVLTAVFQSTYPNDAGSCIAAADLHWLSKLLESHGVVPCYANLEQEKQAYRYIQQINEYLFKCCSEAEECAAHKRELSKRTKEHFRDLFEKLYGCKLYAMNGNSLYGNLQKKILIRFAPKESAEELKQILKFLLAEKLVQDDLCIILMAVVKNVGRPAIPDFPRKVNFSRQNIWDIHRLVWEMCALEFKQISDITLLVNKWKDEKPVVPPEHRLPSVPAATPLFIQGSREEDIAHFLELMDTEHSKNGIFISGVGGIGKTELAIQIAQSFHSDKGAYYLKYVLPDPAVDEKGKRKEAMRETILHANFSNHSRDGRTDQEEYDAKLGYLLSEYNGALLIIDNFDWPGKALLDLRGEKSFQDLRDIGIPIVITTRYPLTREMGRRLQPLNKEQLLQLMRKHFSSQKVTDDELKELIELVGSHTLTLDLIAKTMSAGNNRIKIADIRKLLSEGPRGAKRFPQVRSEQNSLFEKETLYVHLQKLFPLDSLDEEEQNVLRCAVLLPKGGLCKDWFIDGIASDNHVELAYACDELCEKGWLYSEEPKDSEEKDEDNKVPLIRMEPIINFICKYELNVIPDQYDRFLTELWNIHKSTDCTTEGQLDLAECFENAAKLAADSALAESWKDRAKSIREQYDNAIKSGQKQEVGI